LPDAQRERTHRTTASAIISPLDSGGNPPLARAVQALVASDMWEFSVPPHKDDEHFDLGVWHPSALPAHQQNSEGYNALERRYGDTDRVYEGDERPPSEAEKAVQAFFDEVTTLVDALPEEEVCSRRWSIVLRCNPLFLLISLWPTVATALGPAIAESAKRHGLACYDPQKDVITLPQY
jgi:hypothetical protein